MIDGEWIYILIIVMFSDPDNVEFKCHLVCGSQPGDSQPHYELVCCKGIFRQWNSSLSKSANGSISRLIKSHLTTAVQKSQITLSATIFLSVEIHVLILGFFFCDHKNPLVS